MTGKQGTCPRHPAKTTVANCGICQKPICQECIKARGYFCSDDCREKARQEAAVEAEQSKGERAASKAREVRSLQWLKRIAAGIGIAFLLGALWLTWKFWLDPAGKVSWRWACTAPLRSMRVLKAEEQRLIVLAGNEIAVLDPRDGKPQSRFAIPALVEPILQQEEAEDEDWAGDDGEVTLTKEERKKWRDAEAKENQRVLLLPTGVAVTNVQTVRRFAFDGQKQMEKQFDRARIASVVVSEDGSRAFVQLQVRRPVAAAAQPAPPAPPDGKKKSRMFEPRDTRLVVLNLQNGTELWSRVLEPNVTFVGNATVGGDWVGVSTWFQEGQKPKYALCVLSGDTGKMRWRVISERGPSWGPVVARGMVLFKAEGKLHAVTADGQEKYALAVAPDPDYSRLFREDGEADNDDDAFFDREAYSAHDNWLLVQKKDETACYEVETGKPLWTVSGTFDWHNALVRGDTCFLTVGVEVKKLVKGKMKLPQAVEELQDKESKEEMQKMAESAASREEVSWLAFSRDTGKLLWRQSGLLGEPVGDAKRLVGVVDTQRTSKIEMMTGGEGVLIVQQFSWRNGTVLWRRQSTLGVAEPCVVGKRLIGFEYTREKRSSLLGGMMGNRRPDDEGPKSAGLVALRLK